MYLFCFIKCISMILSVVFLSSQIDCGWQWGMSGEGSVELVLLIAHQHQHTSYWPLYCISLLLSIVFLQNHHHSSLCIPATDHSANWNTLLFQNSENRDKLDFVTGHNLSLMGFQGWSRNGNIQIKRTSGGLYEWRLVECSGIWSNFCLLRIQLLECAIAPPPLLDTKNPDHFSSFCIS